MTKIRVVWANGTEQYFEGMFSWESDLVWEIISDGKKIYIPGCQVRYLERFRE